MHIQYHPSLRNFTITQFSIVSLILVLGLSSYIYSNITHDYSLWGFLRLLDVGSELSIPTFFSILNLFFSSLLLLIIYAYEKIQQHTGAKYWLFLSLIFVFLSADESASIHENFDQVFDFFKYHGLNLPSLGTHNWVIFGLFFVAVIGITLIPFLKSLPKKTLFYFVISGAVFITGAIGFEYLGAIMLKTGFVESKKDMAYLIRRIFEEGFEMYGIAMFNSALYREILNRKITLVLGTPADNAPH